MIHWLWLIPAFISGSCIGSILMGLCCANGDDEHAMDMQDMLKDIAERAKDEDH